MHESELLLEALRRTDLAERTAFLETACAGDQALRNRLEEALARHTQSPATMDESNDLVTLDSQPLAPSDLFTNANPNSPTAQGSPVPIRHGATAGSNELIGSVIAGRYTLVQAIGEGGMGSVYLAEQTQPVKRQVALKLIKSGMDSRGVLARFDAERQALALMDHPNIARIYDGGLTPDGQPFFAMELVKGVPLTQYCDEKRLPVRARLELFVPVCLAVQHAHQKGIIHRDLKPGNVLVTEVDGKPTPKVIDFGVAKATEVKLTEMSFSDVGAIVGTPTYMSPEQADPSSVDIDTRSDIYALGVMLYELLVGSPPLHARDFQRGAILEMLRMVREVDPPRPSTRLTTADTRPNIAANRSIEPARLARLLQGELDWVVMKAIEKDRDRRYDTANGFARDIQRYLCDEVVEARPPSPGYRLRKFVKRNKLQVIAASLVLLTLLAGIIGTTLGLREANRQESLARAAASEERKAKEREAERAEGERQAKELANTKRQEAERNLAYAKKGNEILGSVFAGLNPKQIAESGRPLQDVLRKNLLEAVKELDEAAIGDPITVADMQSTLGESLLGLGEYDLALEVLRKARATLESKLGSDHPETIARMNNLAEGYLTAGKLDQALPLFEQTLPLMRSRLGPDHPSTLTGINNLAMSYKLAGKLDKAQVLLEESIPLMKSKFGPEHTSTLISIGNLANVYCATGKLDKALPLLEEALPLMKSRLGLDHPDTMISMNNLAIGYWATAKLDKALPLFEETLAVRKSKLGPDHPDTLNSANNLAEGYRAVGKVDKALPLLEQTLPLMKSKLGLDHPDTLTCMNNLATVYWSKKQLDKSVPLFEQVLKLKETKLGRDHPDTVLTLGNLGVNYKDAGRPREAIPLLEEAHQAAKKNASLPRGVTELQDAYAKAGETAKLSALLLEQLAEARQSQPQDSPQLASLLAKSGQSLLLLQKWAEAEPLLRENLALREKTQPEAPSTFTARAMLGAALLGQKHYAEAEPLLLSGYAGMKRQASKIPPQILARVAESIERLAKHYETTGKSDQAAKLRKELQP